MSVVTTGSRIAIHYRMSTQDGRLVAESAADSPLEFVVGGSDALPGINRTVIGMCAGESRRVTLGPEEAYGPSRSPVVRRIERHLLPNPVAPGDVVRVSLGGTCATLWVVSLAADSAQLSSEHPLAGQTLEVELSVARILD